jgi:hypothetical protein
MDYRAAVIWSVLVGLLGGLPRGNAAEEVVTIPVTFTVTEASIVSFQILVAHSDDVDVYTTVTSARGSLNASLEVSFDSTGKANVVGITFFKQVPGTIAFADYTRIIEKVQTTRTSGIRGTLISSKAIPVKDGRFINSGVELVYNKGTMSWGPYAPSTVDLAKSPMRIPLRRGLGLVKVTPPASEKGESSYHVSLEIPISSAKLDAMASCNVAHEKYESTVRYTGRPICAIGTFTRPAK